MTLAETVSIKQSRKTQNVQTLAIFFTCFFLCKKVDMFVGSLELASNSVPGIGNLRKSLNLDPADANNTMGDGGKKTPTSVQTTGKRGCFDCEQLYSQPDVLLTVPLVGLTLSRLSCVMNKEQGCYRLLFVSMALFSLPPDNGPLLGKHLNLARKLQI
ncbi:hypothetical protein NQZ68_020608 [Dissostichus eleginoides]|nr:hypothetical protein NQZ68_020608 [Dissostichus eleginoides]